MIVKCRFKRICSLHSISKELPQAQPGRREDRLASKKGGKEKRVDGQGCSLWRRWLVESCARLDGWCQEATNRGS